MPCNSYYNNNNSSTEKENQLPHQAAQLPRSHYTLAVVRHLTKPYINPPAPPEQLRAALEEPWPFRVTVDPKDYTTQNHWQNQPNTPLLNSMLVFDMDDTDGSTSTHHKPNRKATASLHPYFSFGNPGPFFKPWEDVGNCIKQLMLHQVASYQTSTYIALASRDLPIFISTAGTFDEENLIQDLCLDVKEIHPDYYLLRCHHSQATNQLLFGYHATATAAANTTTTADSGNANNLKEFQPLHTISLEGENWRLRTCIILKNIARILHCLQDFAVPLLWNKSPKLSLIKTPNNNNTERIQKIYETEFICSIKESKVSDMIHIYEILEKHRVPYTDRLVSIEQHMGDHKTICQFAPIGRAYLPVNLKELLDAMICIAEALVKLHELNIMHRDIRWANVFHALEEENNTNNNYHNTSNTYGNRSNDLHFSDNWYLFDFEFAAPAPQPAFAAHTLTPGNHAPEMVDTDMEIHSETHGPAVDIWGIGYLLQTCHVDLPASHANDLKHLQKQCLQNDPSARPTALECLETLRELHGRPMSLEKQLW